MKNDKIKTIRVTILTVFTLFGLLIAFFVVCAVMAPSRTEIANAKIAVQNMNRKTVNLAIKRHELIVGMTDDEVWLSWGKPRGSTEINKAGNDVVQYTYPTMHAGVTTQNGHVVSWWGHYINGMGDFK
jgi:hypothetical protein